MPSEGSINSHYHIVRVTKVSPELASTTQQLMDELSFTARGPMTVERLQSIADNPESAWFMAQRSDGTVAGMVVLVTFEVLTNRRGLVETLVVSKDHRRQGIARQLIEAVIAECRRRDVNTRTITEADGPAAKLFEQLGFFSPDSYRMYILETGAAIAKIPR